MATCHGGWDSSWQCAVRARLPRSMAEDSAATADQNVRAVSPVELEEAVQLAAAQSVDSDAHVSASIEFHDGCSGSGWGSVRRRQAKEKSTDAVRGELVTAERWVHRQMLMTPESSLWW